MRLLPHNFFLLALRGQTAIGRRPLPSKREALDGLRRLTGQDFGLDADAWAEWIRRNCAGLYRRRNDAP